jgi:hypothetical protein
MPAREEILAPPWTGPRNIAVKFDLMRGNAGKSKQQCLCVSCWAALANGMAFDSVNAAVKKQKGMPERIAAHQK